ncbi:MAG: hypothetical protein JXR37_08215 [Kiritimatiellae bacterium]|nr:hypothetical protein [Kiritimatiellia bacterium]
MKQPDLFPDLGGMTSARLAAFLNEQAPRPVLVKTTQNRSTMISVDFSRHAAIYLRLHEQYLHAPTPVLQALRLYLHTRKRAAWQPVARYAAGIRPGPAGPPPPIRLRAAGRTYNLREIRDAMNQRFFRGRLKCRIGWARAAPQRRRRRRSVRYGRYSETDNTIRVHPGLDSPAVPRQFVEYIVFHEMLHAVVPTVRHGSRVFHHPPQFRALERAFPDLPAMERLCETLLHKLA